MRLAWATTVRVAGNLATVVSYAGIQANIAIHVLDLANDPQIILQFRPVILSVVHMDHWWSIWNL